MTLGLDYDGVINKRPVAFRELAEGVLNSGGEVYIVSAVHEKNIDKTRWAIERSQVPYTDMIIIGYVHHNEVPRLKHERLSEVGVQMFIDDRKDTVHYLNKRGITSLHFELK